MNLKTSFFNKSIFKSDIKRFWWISVISTLLILISCVLPVYNQCIRVMENPEMSTYSTTPFWYSGSTAIPIITALGVGVLLFTFMHFANSVSALHSLPIKRITIFSTKIITGFILTLSPVIINGLIYLTLLLNPGFKEFYGIIDVLKWTSAGILYTMIVFSLTVLVNMMTGNPVGTIVFTLGFAVLPLIFTAFFQSILSHELYGFYMSNENLIINYLYVSASNIVKPEYYSVYLILSAMFLIMGFILYRIRKLENYGEVIAFSALKPVFITIVGIIASALSYTYFISGLNLEGILYLIPFGLLGTVIAWMISRKSINPKGIHKPVIIYICAALVFAGIIHFDLTGYERRIPSLENIECALVSSDRDMMRQMHYKGKTFSYTIEGEKSPYFYGKQDIEKVRELHRYLIDTKDADLRRDELPIEYTLKNGRKLKRIYCVNYETDMEILKPIFESEELKALQYPILDGSKKEYISVRILDERLRNGEFATLYPDNPYTAKLLEALEKDLTDATYEDYMLGGTPSLKIVTDYKVNKVYDEGYPELYRPVPESTVNTNYYIRRSYKNTLAVLKEMGYYDRLPTAEDIESAAVNVWKVNNEGNTTKQKDIPVISAEEIKELYSMFDVLDEIKGYRPYKNGYNVEIQFCTKEKVYFTVSGFYSPDNIPQILRKYTEQI